jgi:hypothetical protein
MYHYHSSLICYPLAVVNTQFIRLFKGFFAMVFGCGLSRYDFPHWQLGFDPAVVLPI